jgi:hypothetical protein
MNIHGRHYIQYLKIGKRVPYFRGQILTPPKGSRFNLNIKEDTAVIENFPYRPTEERGTDAKEIKPQNQGRIRSGLEH